MARHRAFEANPVVAEILRARQPDTGRSRPSERPAALALTAAGQPEWMAEGAAAGWLRPSPALVYSLRETEMTRKSTTASAEASPNSW